MWRTHFAAWKPLRRDTAANGASGLCDRRRASTGSRWTRLSSHSFDANQARLQLHVLAYNLDNFLRRLALPASVKHWTLTTLREKLIKIGAKVVRHAKYVTFQMAEVAVPRRLYRAILDRIRRIAETPIRPAPT